MKGAKIMFKYNKKIKYNVFGFILIGIIILITYSSCIFELPVIVYNEGTLEYTIEQIRVEYKLPAIAVCILNNDEEPKFVATGYRNYRNPDILVSKNDKWHIGSITKSMTSTLIAKLIETDSRFRWDLSIKEVFPEIENGILPVYKNITFVQLLSHTAGIITDITKVNGWANYYTDTSDIKSQRYKIVKDILKYAKVHLDGLKGASLFLTNESFNKLHTSVTNSYAMGWVVEEKDIWHNGSNTKLYALLYIYYDNNLNQSRIIFITFNACYNKFEKNNEIMNKIFTEISK